MTIEKDYQDLISAFAFGCLDVDEQSSFLDNLSRDQYFNWYELGEFQNLASLLPSILTIEKPGDDVKAKVAQRLYSYKDEIRAKKKRLTEETIEKEPEIKKATEKPIPPVKEELPKQETIEDIKINYEDDKLESKEEIQKITSEKKKDDLFRPSQATQISGRDLKSFLNKKDKHKVEPTSKTVEKSKSIETKQDLVEKKEEIKIEEKKITAKPDKEKVEPVKKSTYIPLRDRKTYLAPPAKNYGPVIFLLFILMIAGFLWLYFSTDSRITNLEQRIDRLKFEISGLTTSFKKNSDLQELLTTKNVAVINLEPTRISKDSYGKLIISFDKNQGFYQMFNMPKLEKSMSYQLWVNVSRSYFSLGVFSPSEDDNPEYYTFKLPQLSGKQKIKFLVTKEQKLGANKPGRLIYLQGQL